MLGRVATTNETLLSILIPIGALVGGTLPNIFNSISINFILIAILSIAISLFYLLDKDIQRIKKLNLLKWGSKGFTLLAKVVLSAVRLKTATVIGKIKLIRA